MTAVLYDEPATAEPTPRKATKRVQRTPIEAGSDPLVDASVRLLSVPVRHLYAALWRAGLIEVTD